jgi:DNA polymerase-3 subunit delta
MPRIPFDDFSRQLKRGDIPPAVYLFGEEDVLKDEMVRAIIDRVLDPGSKDFNLDQRSASQLDPESVETLCTTLPMMAERRVVVIRDVEAWGKRAGTRSAMLRYLERPAPETVLILVQGVVRRDDRRDEADVDLARLATTVQVDAYSTRMAEKWVRKRAEDRGISLTEEAAVHLVRAVQGSLGAARSELDKLAGLGGAEAIDVETLARTLGVRRGETPDDWWEAVIGDRTGEAAEMLPYLLSQPGVSGAGLLSQLGTQLVGLGVARAQFDRGSRGSALERAIFGALMRARPPRLDYRSAAAVWSRVVERWPTARLSGAIRAARRADRRLKSTSVSDERGILVDLLMEISPMAGITA